jgi:anaerobic magnesium-protoporphyrin IX monomethyl ester cyclase
MDRILFINPWMQQRLKKKKIRPVGLAYVLTAVQKAGISFDFLDMYERNMSVAELDTALARKPYDIVAFGCLVTAFNLVSELATCIRRNNPQAVIIAGNSVASAIPELLLSHTDVDVAVLGEGDRTIVELLRALLHKEPLEGVAGIAHRKDGNIHQTVRRSTVAELDTIGFPEWHYFESDAYNEGYFAMAAQHGERFRPYPLSSARGCPYNCTFCYHVFRGEPYRRCSPDAIVREFERLHYRYGATFVQFSDELSFPAMAGIRQFVERLERLPFRLPWSIVTYSNLFKRAHVPFIRRMKEAGCFSICFALENADPEILRAMGKPLSLDDCSEQIEALREGGVWFGTSVIFGYPQETLRSIQTTFDFCERYGIVPGVGFLQPLPRTPIYDWAVANGHIQDEVEYLRQAGDREVLHLNLTSMPPDEFVAAVVGNISRLAAKQRCESQCQFLQLLEEYRWQPQP